MNHATPDLPCACPGCMCQVSDAAHHQRDGKAYCSQACADRHPGGQACPNAECHCESSVKVLDRAVSDSQLDEAIEENLSGQRSHFALSTTLSVQADGRPSKNAEELGSLFRILSGC